MFFLITNIIAGKRYPQIATQFIIGCILYIVSFIIIVNIFSNDIFDQYKYYILALLLVDAAFMVYLAKNNQNNSPVDKEDNTENATDTTSLASNSNGLFNNESASEADDTRISHDISSTGSDNYELFSLTEEEKTEPENTTSEKSISLTTPD